MILLWGTWVRSLVRELGFHMPCNAAKKGKKRKKIWTILMDSFVLAVQISEKLTMVVVV